MSSNFPEAGNIPTFNPHEDTNSFSTTDIEPLETHGNIDINDPFSFSMTSNKPVISVARRNERERKRVRLVNQGFAILRDRVPRDRCSRGRRSSKVETLRAAIMYIRQLQQLLIESQMHYQEQDMMSRYSYGVDDSYQNSPMSSVCDTYSLNDGYPPNIVQTPSYSPIRISHGIQQTNQVYDRHLSLPWFS